MAQTPPTVKHVYIEDYGVVDKADLELGKLTVLYGPNGGGKSTILNAIYDTMRKAWGYSPHKYVATGVVLVHLTIGDNDYTLKYEVDNDKISASGDVSKLPFPLVRLHVCDLYDRDEVLKLAKELISDSIIATSMFASALGALCSSTSDSDCTFDIHGLLRNADIVKVIRRGEKNIIAEVSKGELAAISLILNAYSQYYSLFVRRGVVPVIMVDWPEFHYIIAFKVLDILLTLPVQLLVETRSSHIARYALKRSGVVYYVKHGYVTRITEESELD